jgi:hypothetical protein
MSNQPAPGSRPRRPSASSRERAGVEGRIFLSPGAPQERPLDVGERPQRRTSAARRTATSRRARPRCKRSRRVGEGNEQMSASDDGGERRRTYFEEYSDRVDRHRTREDEHRKHALEFASSAMRAITYLNGGGLVAIPAAVALFKADPEKAKYELIFAVRRALRQRGRCGRRLRPAHRSRRRSTRRTAERLRRASG